MEKKIKNKKSLLSPSLPLTLAFSHTNEGDTSKEKNHFIIFQNVLTEALNSNTLGSKPSIFLLGAQTNLEPSQLRFALT
jgi:hypothetical protein